MKIRKYIVYKHTSPSGKCYIGITQQKLEDRWRNGKGYANNQHFYRAIQKYGWENFKHEILFVNLTKEEAEQKEIELIAYYKSNNKSFGYNIQNGGSSNGKHSEESINKIRESATNPSKITRNRMSQSQKARLSKPINNPMYGKHHSEDARRKISEGHIGKHISNEVRQKMSESHKGKNSKSVCQYTTDGDLIKKYNSLLEAHNETGVNMGSISSCCKGKLKTAGGYIWRYTHEKFGQAI